MIYLKHGKKDKLDNENGCVKEEHCSLNLINFILNHSNFVNQKSDLDEPVAESCDSLPCNSTLFYA